MFRVWALMTHHVHSLCTPSALPVQSLCNLCVDNNISLMMQSLGRQHVRYFNSCYGWSETLWEGCYKFCLLQAEDCLLALYPYIELNPVRANMVEDSADYQ
jgi:putative transposase